MRTNYGFRRGTQSFFCRKTIPWSIVESQKHRQRCTSFPIWKFSSKYLKYLAEATQPFITTRSSFLFMAQKQNYASVSMLVIVALHNTIAYIENQKRVRINFIRLCISQFKIGDVTYHACFNHNMNIQPLNIQNPNFSSDYQYTTAITTKHILGVEQIAYSSHTQNRKTYNVQ